MPTGFVPRNPVTPPADGAETGVEDTEGGNTLEDSTPVADGQTGADSSVDDLPTEKWSHAQIDAWVEESELDLDYPRDPTKADKIAAIHAALAHNISFEE